MGKGRSREERIGDRRSRSRSMSRSRSRSRSLSKAGDGAENFKNGQLRQPCKLKQLNPDPHSEKLLDPDGSATKECGSTALIDASKSCFFYIETLCEIWVKMRKFTTRTYHS